ncbi:MAG: GTP cyclohydrolase II, partial [Burkholderiales bacterium]|nr:GTP cyclohydrolase II [Burkholderiales bacterium]
MHVPVPSSRPQGSEGTPPIRVPWLSRLLARDARVGIRRAIGDLLAGRPIVVAAPGATDRLVVPVESLDAAGLAALHEAGAPTLVVSATRAAALGGLAEVSEIALPRALGPHALMALAAGARAASPAPPVRADLGADAAIELVKLAKLLPAVVSVPAAAGDTAELARVDAEAALAFRAGHARSLRRVSSAPVPMRAVSDAELVVFRDELGEHWSMIVVGRPDTRGPVPVRLHSACLTGDAFGSLRCDCGDQLQMALAKIAALGGGALLYLAQEGCGLGLANKMRAYGLQEQGLDTVDANTTLGFETDERRYDVAAAMLEAVGIREVALLTNNPSKLAALRSAGIDVRERIPLLAPVGVRNRGYLEAKRRRAGH